LMKHPPRFTLKGKIQLRCSRHSVASARFRWIP